MPQQQNLAVVINVDVKNNHPEPAPDLASLLRAEADRVELDPQRMLLRVRTETLATPTRSWRDVSRVSVPLAAAAVAAAIVVMAGGQILRNPTATPASPAATAPAPTLTDSAAPTEESVPLGIEEASGAALTPSLSTQDRDWALIGQDEISPEKMYRAAAREQLLGISSAGISVSEQSQFSVQFNGGQPPNATGTATRWLTVGAQDTSVLSAIDVRVRSGLNRRTLTIYAGASGGPASVVTLVDQRELSRAVGVINSSGGSVIEVDLSSYPDDQQVIFRLLPNDGGTVSVSGARLSE